MGLEAVVDFQGFTDATRAAAAMSTVLARDHAVNLGLKDSLVNTGVYDVRVNDPCFITSLTRSSFTSADEMCF